MSRLVLALALLVALSTPLKVSAFADLAKEGSAEASTREKKALSRLEQLEIQSIAKDVKILSLSCQQQIGAVQLELRKKISKIRKDLGLDEAWEISDDGTEFWKDRAKDQGQSK